MVHPGDCRHFGHPTKLHNFKSRKTDEVPWFGGPIPVCDCWHFGDKGDDPHEDFGCIPWAGVGGGKERTYRHARGVLSAYMCVCMCVCLVCRVLWMEAGV